MSLSDLEQEYTQALSSRRLKKGEKRKNWNIPKMHLHSHAFDDIEDKGSLSVFNSMFNEPLHGPLKKSYLRRSNFKNIESQVRI